MKAWPWPKGPAPIRRDLFVEELITELRLVVGLSPDHPAPGETAASRVQPLPSVASDVDLGAWLAWALAGLSLFTSKPLPSLFEGMAVARRVLVCLAMDRVGGNVTHGAALLRTNRRTVREILRRAGAYRKSKPVRSE